MKIARVSFLGLRGLEDATYDLANPATGEPHSLVVVTGPAASGKTRFLEAIIAGKEVAAPYGAMVSSDGWLRGEDEAAKIILHWALNPQERAFTGLDVATSPSEALFLGDATRAEIDEGLQTLLERYEHDHTKGKLEYFPTNRQIPKYGAGHGLEAIQQRLLRGGSDERKYSFVPRLVESLARDGARADYFTTLLGYLSSTVKIAPLRDPSAPLAIFTSTNGLLSEAHELSASESDAVLFAATATLLSLSSSVVLVDRPELHIHPEAATRFVQALCSLGRDNQVIVSTTSPEVIASVDPSQVIRLGKGQ